MCVFVVRAVFVWTISCVLCILFSDSQTSMFVSLGVCDEKMQFQKHTRRDRRGKQEASKEGNTGFK